MRFLKYFGVFLIYIGLINFKRFYYKDYEYTSKYLLLIAHPDDESFFFAPTLLNLKGEIQILCLSSGGYYGKQEIRKQELKKLCEKYGFGLIIYDLEDNQDWDPFHISKLLEFVYLSFQFRIIITFDKFGVSKHKNHISCYYAAKIYNGNNKSGVLFLKSKNLIEKYIVDFRTSKKMFITSYKDYYKPIEMMMHHKSQLLYFRYLYMMFSSYMSYNDFLDN